MILALSLEGGVVQWWQKTVFLWIRRSGSYWKSSRIWKLLAVRNNFCKVNMCMGKTDPMRNPHLSMFYVYAVFSCHEETCQCGE